MKKGKADWWLKKNDALRINDAHRLLHWWHGQWDSLHSLHSKNVKYYPSSEPKIYVLLFHNTALTVWEDCALPLHRMRCHPVLPPVGTTIATRAYITSWRGETITSSMQQRTTLWTGKVYGQVISVKKCEYMYYYWWCRRAYIVTHTTHPHSHSEDWKEKGWLLQAISCPIVCGASSHTTFTSHIFVDISDNDVLFLQQSFNTRLMKSSRIPSQLVTSVEFITSTGKQTGKVRTDFFDLKSIRNQREKGIRCPDRKTVSKSIQEWQETEFRWDFFLL